MKHDRPFLDSVRMGFEIEFISQLDDSDIIDVVENEMGVELDSHLFILPFSEPKLNYGKWSIIYDSTVYEDRRGTINPGLEVVTPVSGYDEAMSSLKRFLSIMRFYMKTNHNCSLHVNVSYPGVREVDTIQMACAVHQLGLTEKYGRTSNENTCSQFKHIVERVKENRYFKDKLNEALLGNPSLVRQDKHYDVNFMKLYEPDPWLEFRMIGGNGYHLRGTLFEDIDSIIKVCERVSSGEDFTGMIGDELKNHTWENAGRSQQPAILEFFEREELNFWL